MTEIELGDKVRCTLTGFTGTAVAKTEFINGCVQWSVLPRLRKKSKSLTENVMPEEVGIDEQSLEIIKPLKKKVKKQDDGGPMTKGLNQRGF